MNRFHWSSLMHAGMRGLGLKPDEFWGLTPAELQLLLGRRDGVTPMRRDGLDALMATYPDSVKGRDDDRD
ncbi:rcc01693 family protein [Marivita hallyeonensis]|uniref:rcc01693 family protein n=1 Tax=Marivita hallyeonensis TaxID=996342 RepID=UPI00093548A1|nr:rcc01693 family protein [Marivita hallyeonensis]